MIKRALFDFDGTIADSRDLGIKIMNDLAPKYGYKQVPESEHEAYYHMSLKERMESIGLGYKKLVPLTRDFVREFKRHAAGVDPVAGVVDVISHMHSLGIGITIISSNSKENINIFLKKHGITCIDRVVGVKKMFGKEKFIKRELKRLGLSPQEAIYIGDEVRDIEACRKAGVKMVVVTWGFDSPAMLEAAEPDYIISTPDALPGLIT